MKNEQFKITVRDQEYIVSRIPHENNILYRVETGCDYMFCLLLDNSGEWQIKDANVMPIDSALVPAIGEAIITEEADGKFRI